jgi:hypothetical protein
MFFKPVTKFDTKGERFLAATSLFEPYLFLWSPEKLKAPRTYCSVLVRNRRSF